MSRALTERQANAVYDVLVSLGGAQEESRVWFVRELTTFHGLGPLEWRFMGHFGFGGKFYNSGAEWYVSCYPEDETHGRRLLIDRINAELAWLRADESLAQPSVSSPDPSSEG